MSDSGDLRRFSNLIDPITASEFFDLLRPRTVRREPGRAVPVRRHPEPARDRGGVHLRAQPPGRAPPRSAHRRQARPVRVPLPRGSKRTPSPWDSSSRTAARSSPHAHTHLPELGYLVLGLEAELGCRVQGNVYLSPPGESSFLPHYDTHDVFVAQAHGSKQWVLFEGPDSSPPTRPFQPGDRHPGEERASFTHFAQATLCYVPRGVMHPRPRTGSPSTSRSASTGCGCVSLVLDIVQRAIEHQRAATHRSPRLVAGREPSRRRRAGAGRAAVPGRRGA